MTQLNVQSIQDSVRKGTLVELASDYRTSRTVRAFLPEQALCAMSTSAFDQHLQQGTIGEKQSRVEAICAVLEDVLTLSGETARPGFDFTFRGENGRPERHPLKLEWFAPNKCWVVLLPSECLRTVEKRT